MGGGVLETHLLQDAEDSGDYGIDIGRGKGLIATTKLPGPYGFHMLGKGRAALGVARLPTSGTSSHYYDLPRLSGQVIAGGLTPQCDCHG